MRHSETLKIILKKLFNLNLALNFIEKIISDRKTSKTDVMHEVKQRQRATVSSNIYTVYYNNLHRLKCVRREFKS